MSRCLSNVVAVVRVVGLATAAEIVCWSSFTVMWLGPGVRARYLDSRFGWTLALGSGLLCLAHSVSIFREARRRWVRFQWASTGHCHACGYGLRATPARCPECGAESWSPASNRTTP